MEGFRPILLISNFAVKDEVVSVWQFLVFSPPIQTRRERAKRQRVFHCYPFLVCFVSAPVVSCSVFAVSNPGRCSAMSIRRKNLHACFLLHIYFTSNIYFFIYMHIIIPNMNSDTAQTFKQAFISQHNVPTRNSSAFPQTSHTYRSSSLLANTTRISQPS